jgi:hypothetical protein
MTEALRSGLSSRSADCPRFKGWVLPTELLCELRDGGSGTEFLDSEGDTLASGSARLPRSPTRERSRTPHAKIEQMLP